MFLSNRMVFSLATLCLSTLLTGCFDRTADSPGLTPLLTERVSEIPFAQNEPTEFSAEVVITTGSSEIVRGYARKGNDWKLTIFGDDGNPVTEFVNAETKLQVNHSAKTSFEASTPGPGFEPDAIQEMTLLALREKQYTRFEKLGSDGPVERFRAINSGSAGDSTVIHYDTNLRMIVKQEFQRPVGDTLITYELRNVRLEVPDETFRVPAGYKRVSVSNSSRAEE
jgi:hypothetical protein